MFPQKSLTATFALAFLISIHADFAQAASRFRVKLTGIVKNTDLRLKGTAYFSLFERRGSIKGLLDDGTKCDGHAKLNFIFSRGIGSIECENDLSLTFSFSMISLLPPRGRGSGLFLTEQKKPMNTSLKFRYHSPGTFKVVVSFLSEPVPDED